MVFIIIKNNLQINNYEIYKKEKFKFKCIKVLEKLIIYGNISL